MQWDEFDWNWAAHNVSRDYQELEKLLFSFMDNLTWWLQPEIKRALEKQNANTQNWPQAEGFVEELREMGASPEYVEKEARELQPQVDPQEEGDSFELIRGPNAANSTA